MAAGPAGLGNLALSRKEDFKTFVDAPQAAREAGPAGTPDPG